MKKLNLSGDYIKTAVLSGWDLEYVVESILAYLGYIYKTADLKEIGEHSDYHYQLSKECQSVVSIKLFGEVKKFEIDTEWSNIDIEHKFDAFMKRVIHNAVSDFLKSVRNKEKRKTRFDPEKVDDTSESSLIEAVYLDTYDIDKFYFRLFNGGIIEISNTMLGLALTALNDNKRQVFLTAAIFNMKNKHISHLFSMDVNTVKYNKKKAKEFLKQKLEKQYGHKEKNMNNQKLLCFAYKNGECCALDEMICEKQNCPFFKTDKQYISELKKSMEALAELPTERQRDIADQYYGGKMPWRDDKMFDMRGMRDSNEV